MNDPVAFLRKDLTFSFSSLTRSYIPTIIYLFKVRNRNSTEKWTGLTHLFSFHKRMRTAHSMRFSARLHRCVKTYENKCIRPGPFPTINSLCAVLEKIYDSTGFIIPHSYCFSGMIHKNPSIDACMCLRKSAVKKEMCQDSFVYENKGSSTARLIISS